MKKITTLVLISLMVLINKQAIAQNLIAVQNGGTPRFYSILQDAIITAQNKDTIYIPGGAYSFNNNSITINKELHLIGTGHSPDSIAATGITLLNADIRVVTGASNSTYEGLYLNGDFFIGLSTQDEDVDNITVSRCNCGRLFLSRLSTNWLVRENIVRGSIYGQYLSGGSFAQNNVFSNNIIEGYLSGFGPNNVFRNNIFLSPTIGSNDLDGFVFQNNIFTKAFAGTPKSCIFDNNLFFFNFTIFYGCLGSNNITSQTSASTLVNQSGDTFSYTNDYHLKTNSPGKGAGKDGTDIGIYGGAYPWKEGSIPSNPHFQSIQIAPKTDTNGNLNLKIKVAAQDH